MSWNELDRFDSTPIWRFARTFPNVVSAASTMERVGSGRGEREKTREVDAIGEARRLGSRARDAGSRGRAGVREARPPGFRSARDPPVNIGFFRAFAVGGKVSAPRRAVAHPGTTPRSRSARCCIPSSPRGRRLRRGRGRGRARGGGGERGSSVDRSGSARAERRLPALKAKCRRAPARERVSSRDAPHVPHAIASIISVTIVPRGGAIELEDVIATTRRRGRVGALLALSDAFAPTTGSAPTGEDRVKKKRPGQNGENEPVPRSSQSDRSDRRTNARKSGRAKQRTHTLARFDVRRRRVPSPFDAYSGSLERGRRPRRPGSIKN